MLSLICQIMKEGQPAWAGPDDVGRELDYHAIRSHAPHCTAAPRGTAQLRPSPERRLRLQMRRMIAGFVGFFVHGESRTVAAAVWKGGKESKAYEKKDEGAPGRTVRHRAGTGGRAGAGDGQDGACGHNANA